MIDLGSSVEFEVKWAGAVYKLREPSAKEMGIYQSKIEEAQAKGNSIDALIQFVSDLGLPKEIAEALPASKLAVLVESIVGEIGKKN